MNKTFRTVIEVAFSLFIGLLIVFTVSSLLGIIWPEPNYYETDMNNRPQNYEMLYRALAAVTIATALQFGSLFMSERLRVIANGILFGGVFTTFYGVISINSYNSPSKWWIFFITLFALVVATAVGWLKFVRMAEAKGTPPPPELGEVSERLHNVEVTLERMGRAFGSRED